MIPTLLLIKKNHTLNLINYSKHSFTQKLIQINVLSQITKLSIFIIAFAKHLISNILK